jgi:tetratricopeptide (TPR) repeat protein
MQQKTDQPAGIAAPWLRRRYVILAVAVLVVIAVIVTVGILLSRGDTKQKTALQTARDKADTAMSVGNYDASLQTLQQAESKAHTKQQKLDLYADLAAAAGSAGKMDQALHYFDLRHQLDAATAKQDAYLMGSYYERTGDTAKAIAQYQIALGYKKSLGGDNTGDIASLQARIDDLKGQQ